MTKLSELSKPVAWTSARSLDVRRKITAFTDAGSAAEYASANCWEKIVPLYSQEVVTALLAELEASKKSNAFLKEQLAKLANFNPDWDMLEACRESWCKVAAALKGAKARLEAKDKRIAELEAKLATPVRLPGSFYPDGDIDCPLVVELDEAVEAIRAAGFVVEGGEQDG